MHQQKYLSIQQHPGTGLLDIILSLFVLGFMILLIGSFTTVRQANRQSTLRAQAAALADEELNALRRLDVTTLTNQTNGSFKNVLYNAGDWSVVANASAGHSSPNVVEIPGSTISGTISGRLLFPAGAYGDGTLEAKWRLATDSPANASFGYFFRATDSANGYRLRLARSSSDLDGSTGGTQNVLFEKVVNGTSTKIDSRLVTISVDTWYTLQVVLAGSNISIYLDGNQFGSGPFTDTTFTSGPAALITWNGAHAYVDDVETVTTSTQNWNFDAEITLPASWVRLGLNDIPDATPTIFDDNGLLTLSTFPVGSSTTTLKQATIVIRWTDRTITQSYTVTGLLGRSGVGL